MGCEPSCILTFRDEYPDLLKGHAVQAVARLRIFWRSLSSAESREPLEAEFKRQNVKALIHGHCHEKALIDRVS